MTAKAALAENWQADLATLTELYQSTDKNQTIDVGTSPKTELYRENKLRLYHYRPLAVKQKKTPLLLVYSLVNRVYITDLEPDKSLVLRILEAGYPVFLIDWGCPDSSDKFIGLDDYINGYMYRCVQQVRRHTKKRKIDLLGICQGGVFSLCYTASYPTHIRKLITLVTPTDFQRRDNIISRWVSGICLIARNNAQPDNIAGANLTQLFNSLKPYLLYRDKYTGFGKRIKNSKHLQSFLRMEKWLAECPDLAGKAATEFIEIFYKKNSFFREDLQIGEHKIQLQNIKVPVLNLFAEKDHLVPVSSSQALAKLIKPSLYQEKLLEGGHIGAFTRASSQKQLIASLQQWL